MNYYCLADDGELWILGDHGDIEAAQATAEDMGLQAICIIGEKTAAQWRATLENTK